VREGSIRSLSLSLSRPFQRDVKEGEMKWLHFLGKSYYPSPETFVREARQFGVNRRVSLNTLGAFSWGDQVFLGFGDFITKSRKTPPNPSFCFGFFVVSGVGGLPREILDELPEDAYQEIQALGGFQVSRGCGGYQVFERVLGLTWSLQEFAAFLRDKFPGVKPSLMGEFREIPRTTIQKGFHWGYSRLLPGTDDWEALKPYFVGEEGTEGMAETVSNYQLRFWESTGLPSRPKSNEVNHDSERASQSNAIPSSTRGDSIS
jgi:hypothetical protein